MVTLLCPSSAWPDTVACSASGDAEKCLVARQRTARLVRRRWLDAELVNYFQKNKTKTVGRETGYYHAAAGKRGVINLRFVLTERVMFVR